MAYCEVFPHRGTARNDLYEGLRTTSYRKHVVIAFFVDDQTHTVVVAGIFYGGQGIARAFTNNQ